MKVFVSLLVFVFVVLQYQLWISSDGVRSVMHLSDQIQSTKLENDRRREKNQVLAAEIEDLKSGLDAVEERARMELGMIREDETFFQIIDRSSAPSK